MVEEAEAAYSNEDEEESGPAEAALMYRIDNIAEVLEQTSHNLAVFERLLPAAREAGKSPRGQYGYQCCGSEIIFFGSGSVSDFSRNSGSYFGSGLISQ